MDNSKIHVFDTTLRDGEQVPGCQLNTEEKVEIAKDLESLGEMSLRLDSPFQALVISTQFLKFQKM